MEFPTAVTVKHGDRVVARLAYGKPDQIVSGPDQEDLIHRLEMPRFVYYPDLGMKYYPDSMPADDPRWWFVHIADSCWPEYTIEPAGPA